MKTINKILMEIFPKKNLLEILAKAVALDEAITKILFNLPEEFLAAFTAAPASTGFHQAYEGGLYEHSMLLAAWLYSRTPAFGGPVDLTPEEVAHIAIFHDFCKVGLYYRDEKGEWQKDHALEKEEGHSRRSIALLAKLGITISQKEKVCILLHMAGGWWDPKDEALLTEEDREWLKNNQQTISAVQWADMKAC